MQPVPKYSEHYSGLCYITIASGGNCLAECLAHERTSRKELVRGLPKIVPACVYRCMFWEPIIPHILLRDSINPLRTFKANKYQRVEHHEHRPLFGASGRKSQNDRKPIQRNRNISLHKLTLQKKVQVP